MSERLSAFRTLENHAIQRNFLTACSTEKLAADRRRGLKRRMLKLALAGLLLPTMAHAGGVQDLLSAVLHQDAVMQRPLPTPLYFPEKKMPPPLAVFEGTLRLPGSDARAGIHVLRDDFGVAAKPELRVSELPVFAFEFIGHGRALIPVSGEPQRSDHPLWEWVLAPGYAWHDPQQPGWSRALIPFSLKETNQNCTHNGLMTFAYQADGTVSRVAWQVGSETCLYFQADLWGVRRALYEPGPVATRDILIEQHLRNVRARLPVRPLSAISRDIPGLDAAVFTPPGSDNATVFGFVADGVHYRSDCVTRHGRHPLCENVHLPSYSTAKSLFAGLSYLLISARWPEFANAKVSEWVPACVLDDGRWSDVAMNDLLNMTTGNFSSVVFQADESAEVMNRFFLALTHEEKSTLACEIWPRSAEPGTRTVYHTTDHYLLGVAMTNFLRSRMGEATDLYDDWLYPAVYAPLDLSRVSHWTQRTYGQARQPFVGYGLMFQSDDVARIGLMLARLKTEEQPFEPEGLRAALFRNHANRRKWPGSRGDAYSHGFWGVEVTEWLNCAEESWIPFLSGYGGISFVPMPNGTVYYSFSDSNQYGFRKAVEASHKFRNICEIK